MRSVIFYLKDYYSTLDKRLFAISALFTALGIFINYYGGLNRRISTMDDGAQYASWLGIFLLAFSFSYMVKAALYPTTYWKRPRFLLLLLIGPALFAWKMSFTHNFHFSDDPYKDAYWNHVFYWPYKMVVITTLLFLAWWLFDRDQPFYGLSIRQFRARPYFIMLLIMVPLIAAASTQPDFLAMYPKLKNMELLSDGAQNGWYKLLYELAYGSDFFSIELFFRGFLVLAFIKFAGKDAILPMACFYCTIHFGKPLGECISSFFGGMILGVLTYHTRTIFGGLIVHLGIAWLMELGGYLGNQFMR